VEEDAFVGNTIRRVLAVMLMTALSDAGSRAQAPRPSAKEIARAVDTVAARVVDSGLSSAIGVAIAMDGRLIFSRGYGWADATNRVRADSNTLWYIASTSKSLTGFGASLLAQQGVLDFGAPIATLLPDVKWPAGVDPSALTLARFLSHTHHINDGVFVQNAAYTGVVPESRWAELIALTSPSGNENLVYGNFGYNIAAMVIDRKRREGWRRFLDTAVYTPAGMHETYACVSCVDPRRIAKPHRPGADGGFVTLTFEKTDATMNSAGGHLSTLHDLARWVIVQMDGGRIDGKQVFPAEAVALSHRLIARHTVEASRHFGPFDRDGWAAGWDIGSYQGERMVSRFGGYATTRSHLSFLPGRRIGVVALVTAPGASAATDIIAALAYDLEAGRPTAQAMAKERLDALITRVTEARRRAAADEAERRSKPQRVRRPLTDYVGVYGDPGYGEIRFAAKGDELFFNWGVLSGPVRVLNADRDEFQIEIAASPSTVTFNFDETRRAQSVSVDNMRFRRR
jgi:CubicO group peptidase (beta-lactamase class C family)